MGFYEYVNALDEILDKLLLQKNKQRQKRLKNESKTNCKKKRKRSNNNRFVFYGISTLFRLFKNKYLKSTHILRYENNSYFLRVNIALTE